MLALDVQTRPALVQEHLDAVLRDERFRRRQIRHVGSTRLRRGRVRSGLPETHRAQDLDIDLARRAAIRELAVDDGKVRRATPSW